MPDPPSKRIIGPLEVRVVEASAQERDLAALPAGSRAGGIKVRLTLGPALIDLEATLEEIVVVVTRLTQEFTKAAIIPETMERGAPS